MRGGRRGSHGKHDEATGQQHNAGGRGGDGGMGKDRGGGGEGNSGGVGKDRKDSHKDGLDGPPI